MLFLVASLRMLAANVDTGQGMKQSKNIQHPQNDGNDYHAVQNGLDCPCMGMKRFTSHRRTPTTIRTSSS